MVYQRAGNHKPDDRFFPHYPDGFPSELKEGAFWVACNEDKAPRVASTKVSRAASSTDPATWRTYDEAVEAYESGRFAGIGRVITPPYVGIDIDDCVDGGEISPEAWEIIRFFDSYTEISPSRTGVKIWIRAELDYSRVRGGLEVYRPHGRYFTITGQMLAQVSGEIEDRQDELEAFIAKEFPEPERKKRRYEGNGFNGEFDLASWLKFHEVEILGYTPDDKGGVYSIVCPWVHEHTGGDTSGTKIGRATADGGTWFKCHHAHCGGRDYHDFRDKVAPRAKGFTAGAPNTPPPEPPPDPKIDPAAYRGLFGEIVETVDPHTEGDPVAVLLSALVGFGSAMGRGPYVQIGATKHRVNLFCGIVGDTAKGRKGSTWDPIENILHAADRHWAEQKITSGLSSGEGLINEVRDKVEGRDKDGKTKIIDMGVKDKRALVMEGELSQALKVMKREGNTLSPVLRNAWDGKTLKTMVKHSPLRATDPHVSILGHITRAELVRHLTETETANGLANRFLWALVKRSKSLPFGGEWHTVDVAKLARRIVGALEFGGRELRLDWADDARSLWCEAYEILTEDRAGMFGAITARAEAQTLRLSMLYALVDDSEKLRREHIESALAVWEYCEDSARVIFGETVGDPDADKVLTELAEAEDGLTRNEIRELFARNKGAEELDRIRDTLVSAGRVTVTKERRGAKRPVEVWRLA